MDERRLLCVTMKYSDCAWVDELRADGWNVQVVTDLNTAHRQLQEHPYLAGLLVPGRIDHVGCVELDGFLRVHGSLEWVGTFESAVLAMSACRDLIVDHLFDHHTLPISPARLSSTLGHAHGHAALRHASRQAQAQTATRDASIVGNSEAAKELLRQILRVAKVDAPVLVSGESGSGKELTAQAIHRHSNRAHGPFVPVNCGAIQATLIQSELFGHEKGAFTGASGQRKGRFEQANGGTLFLDEVGDVPMPMQVKLLRVLQERKIERLGSTESISLDVRVVAATNQPLEKMVKDGSFREDLYYRLNVIRVELPPLRDRMEDVPLLAQHFAQKYARVGQPAPQISPEAMAGLMAYHWPGNVRQLENAVERGCVTARDGVIKPANLPPDLLKPESAGKSAMQVDLARPLPDQLAELTATFEEKYLRRMLKRTRGHVGNCAKLSGLSRRSITDKISLYRIDKAEFKGE